MNETTNFKAWLAGPSKPASTYDLYSLWQAALGRSTGNYHSETDGSIVRITGPANVSLRLSTTKAAAAFKYALEGVRPAPIDLTLWRLLEENQERIDRPANMRVKPPYQPKVRFT